MKINYLRHKEYELLINATAASGNDGMSSIVKNSVQMLVKSRSFKRIDLLLSKEIYSSKKIFTESGLSTRWVVRFLNEVILFRAHEILFGKKIKTYLSFHSVPANLKHARQVIYLHQPFIIESLFFAFKNSFHIFLKACVMRILIRLFDSNNVFYIVQTEYFKRKLLDKYSIKKNRIHVVKPTIKKNTCPPKKQLIHDNFIFYPSSYYFYKNHRLLFRLLKDLKKMSIPDYRILLTLTQEEISSLLKKERIPYENDIRSKIVCTGVIPNNEISSYYMGSKAVIFPSKIETFGLPLIEAALLGKKILVLDKELYREVLDNYSGAVFIKENNREKWADEASIALTHPLKNHSINIPKILNHCAFSRTIISIMKSL